MLFSRKENVFMCLVAFQKMFRKIFSDVWLCSWKYHRKHIFYLLLAFSHIFSVTKRLYNIIYSSKYKQNPEKKSSNSDKRRRDRDRNRSGQRIARSRLRSTRSRDASIAIARRSKRRSRSRSMMSMSVDGDVAIDSFFLPFSFSLFLFYFPRPEVLWSENRNGKSFLLFWLSNLVNWKCFSIWPNLK